MALFLYDTVINMTGSLPSNTELSLALGRTTIVNWTSANTLTYVGLLATGGNVDGMVVTFSNITNSGAITMNFAHDSSLASAMTNRFMNAGGATVNGGSAVGAITYRYNGTNQRWVQIAKTA